MGTVLNKLAEDAPTANKPRSVWVDFYRGEDFVQTSAAPNPTAAQKLGRFWLKARGVTRYRVEGEALGDWWFEEDAHTCTIGCRLCDFKARFSAHVVTPELFDAEKAQHARRHRMPVWRRLLRRLFRATSNGV